MYINYIYLYNTFVIDLSSDQQNALNNLYDWYLDSNKIQVVTLGGYAGTGKTTLLSFLRQKLQKKDKDIKVAFCSYTGKATQVLKNKLIQHNAVYENDNISTIHSLIYKAITNDVGAIIGWMKRVRREVEFDLIVIDEASMVDSNIYSDLISFNIPIIAVGDHGQLPPINGKFNLMEEPMLKLQQIHRQAQENPIIKLSIMAREKGNIDHGYYSDNVKKVDSSEHYYLVEDTFNTYKPDTMILCGYNLSRVKINASVRNALGFETPVPQSTDRVICLRNNHEKVIFNGMLGSIYSIEKKDNDKYKAEIQMDGDDTSVYKGIISAEQFNSTQTLNNILGYTKTKKMDLFDFGYALTVHKAQGSQARKVVLFEERFKKQDDDMWKRWLYTAVTRAEEELLIFG